MELKINKKQDNPLLSRVEIEAEAVFFNEATPKKEDIKRSIASTQKADGKLIVVKDICGGFGAGKASVLVYIYKSEDELKKTEPKKKEKKGATPVEGSEASEEEAPKEEKKEEAKGAPKEKPEKKE